MRGRRQQTKTARIFGGPPMQRRHVWILLVSALCSLVLDVSTVNANTRREPTPPGSSASSSVENGDIIARAEFIDDFFSSTTRVTEVPITDEPTVCQWRAVGGADLNNGNIVQVSMTRNGKYYRLVQRLCTGGTPSARTYWVSDEARHKVVRSYSDTARRSLPDLVYGTAPMRTHLVVNVGTWFWVSKSLWREVIVRTVVPTPWGPLVVRTVATPEKIYFNPGDGAPTVECDGPGRQWNIFHGDRARSDCMHTFLHASESRPGGVFKGRIGIQWTIKGGLGFGPTIPFARQRISAPIDLRVHEIQALANA